MQVQDIYFETVVYATESNDKKTVALCTYNEVFANARVSAIELLYRNRTLGRNHKLLGAIYEIQVYDNGSTHRAPVVSVNEEGFFDPE